jgi:hypothetical protein
MANQCPKPKRPRNPNHGKKTLGLTNQQNEPQMAIRSKILGICRSGYDKSNPVMASEGDLELPSDPFMSRKETKTSGKTLTIRSDSRTIIDHFSLNAILAMMRLVTFNLISVTVSKTTRTRHDFVTVLDNVFRQFGSFRSFRMGFLFRNTVRHPRPHI